MDDLTAIQELFNQLTETYQTFVSNTIADKKAEIEKLWAAIYSLCGVIAAMAGAFMVKEGIDNKNKNEQTKAIENLTQQVQLLESKLKKA